MSQNKINIKNLHAFTLIELLLGLTIFAIVATCLYSVFHGGILLSRQAERYRDFNQDIRLTFGLMEKEMVNMVSYDASTSYPDKKFFVGEKDRVTFMSPTPEGFKMISYYLQKPEEVLIHKVVLGKTTKKNIKVVSESEESDVLLCLIREEKDFVDYLHQAAGKVEVLLTNVENDGLHFYYERKKDAPSTSSGNSSTETTQSSADDRGLPSKIRIEMNLRVDRQGRQENKSVLLVKEIFIPQGS